jgi:DNA mismatch repair ATPase MutL
MFYNVPARRRALEKRNSAAEEFRLLLELVQRFAAHHRRVRFSLRRAGQARPDLCTPGGSVTPGELLRLIFGTEAARDLLRVQGSEPTLGLEAEAFISSARATAYATSSSSSSRPFIIFVNSRLVSSEPLRRCVEAAYAVLQPRGLPRPFVLLELRLPPDQLDVNVSPTKVAHRSETFCSPLLTHSAR